MALSITFFEYFFWGIFYFSPILASLVIAIIVLGFIVGYVEGWSRFNAIYWAFITALTVGYGDIRPLKRKSKVMAILIAGAGIMFAGLIVAITVETASRAFRLHVDLP